MDQFMLLHMRIVYVLFVRLTYLGPMYSVDY